MKNLLFVLCVCFSCGEEEVKPDCTPLKSTMELAAIALFEVERSNPFNYGAEPTKAEVDAYELQYEKFFDAYTQAVTDFHNCKHSN